MTLSEDEAFRLLNKQEWRLGHLYKIKDKEGQVVDFCPNWAQKDLLEPHNLNIVLKARQLGACPPVALATGGQARRESQLSTLFYSWIIAYSSPTQTPR